MGIPRLITYLSPWAVPTVLGCRTADCSTHTTYDSDRNKVFIDGPALAYHIYYRLLASNQGVLNALDAQPSYEELGKATLSYLDELQDHGLQM